VSTSPATEPVTRHIRPRTLHTVVVTLWIVVGAFGGLGIAATIGAVQHLDRLRETPRLSEYAAEIGAHAGALYVAAAVALGALAVVEAILLTLGHVSRIEEDVQYSRHDAPAEGRAPV
jgi:hypothetical protein